MKAEPRLRASPRLRVGREGELEAESSGSFEWIVHRRPAPVAFLATPLMALGSEEELDVRVSLAPGACATVTGQGPTSLLKTEDAVTHRWSFEVGAGAHLTYLPWLTIPFPGSRSRSEVAVRVGPGSSLVAWETMTVGRIAMGERFLFHELHSAWRISDPEGPLLHERLVIRGADRAAGETMLGGRTHLGSLFVAGLSAHELSVSEIRALLGARVDLAGVTRPAPNLLVLRALDRSSERLERAFWPVVNVTREAVGLPRLQPASVARRWFDPPTDAGCGR